MFFYGFDDLTALQRDAVETLARVVGVEVTVSLTYEPGREALVARAETVEELRPLAQRVAELPAQDAHYAPGSRAALHHLERSLFEREPVERIDPGDAVVLLEAGGERAEAELVAQQIHELRRAGVPGDEIVVVHRSRARAAPLLGHVFAQYGIALDSGYAPPLGHTPLGRGLIGAARCALLPPHEARAADLLAYLRTPGLLQTPEIADGLDADVRRRGLRTAAQARERLGWELAELDELAAAPDPGRALCRLARRLFAAPHRARAAALSAGEELDARALRALVRGVDELAELSLTPAGAELVELLEGLAVAPARAHDADAVLLAEPLEVRARRFRVVFVCGLQEGEFPQPARPEPFLSDERRWELAAAGGPRLAPARTRWPPSATCSTPRSRGPPSGSTWPTAALTRRATWPCPRRSSPTWPSCCPPTGPTGAGGGCWPTSCGSPIGRRRRASAPARCRAAAPPTPASSPRAATRSAPARSARSATARSSRRERSRRSPTARCGG